MPELTWLSGLVTLLGARLRIAREEGSVTLEQVAIAAGLLAIAIAAVAVIATVVTKYTDKLQ